MAEEEKKQKKEGRIKKFFREFGEFINRGNVLDMAVGVIVGSAFSAIVTALSNQILKPIINWLLALTLGKNSLNDIYTVLLPVTDEAGVLDLTQSIYIDWGAFINAIINFLLIAFVLFIIIRTVMKMKKLSEEAQKELEEKVEKRIAEREAERKAKEEAFLAAETTETVDEGSAGELNG